MTEKLSNLLFHPMTLIQYRNTKIWKVLVLLFVLAAFSILVPLINLIKNPEFSVTDETTIKSTYNLNLITAEDLPDCKIINNAYSCPDTKPVVLLSALSTITVVSDPAGTYQIPDDYLYFDLTQNNIKVIYYKMTWETLSYNEIPSNWQTLDFSAVKSQLNPDGALFAFFLSGLNQIMMKMLPYTIAFKIVSAFIGTTVKILFFSLLFFFLYARMGNYKYREIFKITTFADVFAVIIGVMFSLLNLGGLTDMISTLLVFIYVGRALLPKMPEDKEF